MGVDRSEARDRGPVRLAICNTFCNTHPKTALIPQRKDKAERMRGFLSALQVGHGGGTCGGIKPDSSGRWDSRSQLL